MAKKAGLVWQDGQGERVLHVVTTQSGVGGIETALVAASNAVVAECWEGLDEFTGATPSVGQYDTVRVTAVLYYVDSSTGSIAKLFIPSPQSGIFLSDGDTVDPTNTLVAAITTAAFANLLAPSGNLVDILKGGSIVRTRFSGLDTSVTP